jgi:hypothetical protein
MDDGLLPVRNTEQAAQGRVFVGLDAINHCLLRAATAPHQSPLNPLTHLLPCPPHPLQDLISLAECFPVASCALLKEGAVAGGAGASGGVLGSLGGMATKAMGALGLGAGAGQPSHTTGTH